MWGNGGTRRAYFPARKKYDTLPLWVIPTDVIKEYLPIAVVDIIFAAAYISGDVQTALARKNTVHYRSM